MLTSPALGSSPAGHDLSLYVLRTTDKLTSLVGCSHMDAIGPAVLLFHLREGWHVVRGYSRVVLVCMRMLHG